LTSDAKETTQTFNFLTKNVLTAICPCLGVARRFFFENGNLLRSSDICCWGCALGLCKQSHHQFWGCDNKSEFTATLWDQLKNSLVKHVLAKHERWNRKPLGRESELQLPSILSC